MNMFKPNSSESPEDYISKIDDPRKTDIQTLFDFIQDTLGKEKPYMVVGMIGWLPYHYKSKSGREGDWPVVSLASQKNYISVYVACVLDGKYLAEGYKDKLPKADIGKSCIRFKKVSDIDLNVLKEILLVAKKTGGMNEVT